MYAVIETGGKQYRVEVGTELEVELLDVEPGQSITLERVLLVADGAEASVGTPVVDGAAVEAEVLRRDRGEKVIAFKYRPKARRRVKKGHRQELLGPADRRHPVRGQERGRGRGQGARSEEVRARAPRGRRRTAGRGGRGPRREAPGRRREGRGGREAGEGNDEEARREGRCRRGAGEGRVEGKDARRRRRRSPPPSLPRRRRRPRRPLRRLPRLRRPRPTPTTDAKPKATRTKKDE